MAQGTFDPQFWLSQAKRITGIPPNADLPADIHKPLTAALTDGRIAEDEHNAAQIRDD